MDLAIIAARLERLADAVRGLAEGQRDGLDAMGEFNTAIAVLDAKGDLRAAKVDELAREILAIRASLTAIEKPVTAHYDGLREAEELHRANVGKWAVVLSPERVAAVVRYAWPLLVAVGVGGVGGANLKGCLVLLPEPPADPDIVTPVPVTSEQP